MTPLILRWCVRAVSFFAAAGALISVLPLGLFILWGWDGTANSMMADGLRRSQWGMTYDGWAGMTLAIVEAIGVLLALAASFSRSPRPRHLGLVALALWAALWLANAVYVFPDGTFYLLHGTAIFFGCSVVRLIAAWEFRRPPRFAPPSRPHIIPSCSNSSSTTPASNPPARG